MKIKKNDQVIIISGKSKDKKKISKVIRIFPKEKKILVKDVNLIKKTTKNNGFVVKEAPIHISNVAFFDSETKKPTKIGFRFENNKKVRFNKKTNKTIIENNNNYSAKKGISK